MGVRWWGGGKGKGKGKARAVAVDAEGVERDDVDGGAGPFGAGTEGDEELYA